MSNVKQEHMTYPKIMIGLKRPKLTESKKPGKLQKSKTHIEYINAKPLKRYEKKKMTKILKT